MPRWRPTLAAGGAFVTDARGIELPLDAALAEGSILRVVVSARRRGRGAPMLTRELLARLPKAELHTHLDARSGPRR